MSQSDDIPCIPSCVFCNIAHGRDEKTTLLYNDEGFVVFRDRKPASKHHYLVCPVKHVKDAKQLKKADIDLVQQLVTVGKQVLTEQGGDVNTARLGFHWPPLALINHLHLHVIAPETDMGFLARQIFRSNSYWFVSPDSLIERLEKMEE